MARETYDESLKAVLEWEGGYTNDAADPGGPTNWGITIFDARMYWKADATAQDVRQMPLSVAKDIYQSKYWDALRCDEMPPGVDYCVFDYGVNSGISRSAKVLQRLLGVAVDGRIGNETLEALQSADPKRIIGDMCDERLAFLQQLRTWPTFGNGWGRRVRGVRTISLNMVNKYPNKPRPKSVLVQPAAVAPPTVVAQSAKAVPPPRTIAQSPIGNGAAVAGAGGAAALVSQVWDAVTSAPQSVLDMLSSLLTKPVFWICLVVLAAGFYVWWKRRQQLNIMAATGVEAIDE